MMIKIITLKKWLLFAFLFFVLFRFYFNVGVAVQKLAFFGFFLGYFLINFNVIYRAFCNQVKQVRWYISIFLLFYFFYFLIIIIAPIFHQTYEFTYYAKFLYFTILSVAVLDVFIFIKKNIQKANAHEVYMNYYIKVTILYILISYIFLFVPTVKEFWIGLIYQDAGRTNFIEQARYITRWGLAGFSGYPFTIICTFAFIFQIHIINKTKVNIKNIIILLILFTGNVMYGRIGMVASFLCAFVWVLYSVVALKKIKIFMYFLTILALAVSALTYYYFTSPEFALMFDWAIAPFVNLITTGEMNNGSVDSLQDMYFMPSDETLLLGDGKYMVDGHYYMNTDAGFMRLMLYSGVFTQFFLYGGVLFLLSAVYNNLRKESKKIALLTVMFFLGAFLVFEYKGEMFYILIATILPLVFSAIPKKV